MADHLNPDTDMANNSVGTQTNPFIQFQQPSLSQQEGRVTMIQTTKSALDKLPPEVRVMIYKEVLVNPMLATYEAIDPDTWYGQDSEYGLSPALLRTCRRVYEEASEILYDQTFIINCDYNDRATPWAEKLGPCQPCPCPLLRYISDTPERRMRLEIPTQSAAMTRARSWKVYVDPSHLDINCHQQFYEFCKSICDSRAKSIEVIVLKTGSGAPTAAHRTLFSQERSSDIQTSECLEPWETLAPLTMLRNVEKLRIRNEYPPYQHEADGFEPSTAVWTSHGPGKVLTQMLQNLVTSNKPTEKLFEMRSNLVKLGQSFERYVPFKIDMNFRAVGQWGEREYPDDWNELHRLGYARYCKYDVPNPNRTKDGANYLEGFLSKARDADLTMQNREFKEQRELVVKHLRANFRRVKEASLRLKIHKPQVRIGVNGGKIWDHKFAPWLVLIEDYAKSFQRKNNAGTAAEFRRQKRRFDQLYASFPREMMLARLDRMLEDQDFASFPALAQEVEDDMDAQLQEMTDAWYNLFKADVYEDEVFCDTEFHVSLTERIVAHKDHLASEY